MTDGLNDDPGITVESLRAWGLAARRTHTRKLYVLAALMFVLVLILGGLLQHEQNTMSSYVRDMCLARQVNIRHSNATWESLEKIERSNQFVNAQIRADRVAAYESAKLVIPACRS